MTDKRDNVSDEVLWNCVKWNVHEAHRAKDPKDAERYEKNANEITEYIHMRMRSKM